MHRGNISHRIIRAITLLLQIPLATSCSSWQTPNRPTKDFVESAHPTDIRVYFAGGEPVLIHKPAVSGDSLLGTVLELTSVPVPADWKGPPGVRTVRELRAIGFPLDSIRSVEVWKTDSGATSVFVIVTVALVLVSASQSMKNWDSNR